MTDRLVTASATARRCPKRKTCDVRCIKPQDWPPAFRAALERACQPGKPSEPGGRASKWRPATLDMRLNGFGLRLAWEAKMGLLNSDSRPGDTVTEDNVDSWIEYLLASGNSHDTIATRLDQVYSMLRVLAKGDWSFILPAREWFAEQAKSNELKLKRTVHPDDLYQYGCDLRHQAETSQELSPVAAAIAYRDGLMFSMLAATVVRRGNFTIIEIGKHLVRCGDEYVLVFAADETKGKKISRKPLPPCLTPQIDLYLNKHRGHLCERAARFGHDDASPRLWLSDEGAPLTQIYQIFARRTKDRYGFVVNPHLFRHCAQTAWAIEDPATSRGGRELLDHASFRTTDEYYEIGTSLGAAERCQRAAITRRDRLSAAHSSLRPSPKRSRAPGRSGKDEGARPRQRRRPVERPLDSITDDEILTDDSNSEIPPLIDTDAMRPRGRGRPPVAPDDRPDDDEQPS